MAAPVKTRAAGTISATLLCCAAATSVLAQATPAPSPAPSLAPVVIDQVTLNDVSATDQLHVTAVPSEVNQSAVAVGNSAVASVENAALDVRATQSLSGNVHATVNAAADDNAGGALLASASATGNTGTAGTCCGALTGQTTQSIAANTGVTSETDIHTDGPGSTGIVQADSAAIGNTWGFETNGGSVDASATQTHNGETYSALGATIHAVDGSAAYTSTAVANNVTSDAAGAPVSLYVSQTADGFRTRADIDVAQGSGGDVAVAATASSNNITITANGAAAALSSDQTNTNPTAAQTVVTLGDWYGAANVSSYGVANSAIISNAGPSTWGAATQTNTGDITASTSFTGGSVNYAGDGNALSTAVGNAYSAYACADCNGALNGAIRQTNSGGVSATTAATSSSPGILTGVASAIGNTATFQVKRN